ncbi:hypothetical protein ACM0CO_23710, partial [Mycobacteroides abscessus subsp. abscessus]|uniref:hypothetical protein n=1 Tax=Mycobacteroides abscessus TaxID=36809 RepID=UPI0039EEC94C
DTTVRRRSTHRNGGRLKHPDPQVLTIAPQLVDRNLSDRFTLSGPIVNQLAVSNLRRRAPMGGHVSDRMAEIGELLVRHA